MYAWSRNGSGQIGIGNTLNKITPQTVPFVDTAIKQVRMKEGREKARESGGREGEREEGRKEGREERRKSGGRTIVAKLIR